MVGFADYSLVVGHSVLSFPFNKGCIIHMGFYFQFGSKCHEWFKHPCSLKIVGQYYSKRSEV